MHSGTRIIKKILLCGSIDEEVFDESVLRFFFDFKIGG